MKHTILISTLLLAVLLSAPGGTEAQTRFTWILKGKCERTGHPDVNATLIINMGLRGVEGGTLNGRPISNPRISGASGEDIDFKTPGIYKDTDVIRIFSGRLIDQNGRAQLDGILSQDDGKYARCTLFAE